MKKLLLILCLLASPAWAQFADPDQRAYSGQMLRAGKARQTITAPWNSTGTGTTNKPQFLIEPAGTLSAAWSASGTGLGVNAPTVFAGNLIDLQKGGTTEFSVGNNGNTSLSGGLNFINANNSIIGQAGTQANPSINFTGSGNYNGTTGITQTLLNFKPSFVTASGNAIFNDMTYAETVNQTVSATGVSRSLIFNPTITSAYDYRALETAAYTDNLLGNPVVATTYGVLFNAPTITATSVSQTVTTASTVDIKGAPVASTNVTITTPYALNVEAGNINSGGIISGYNGVATKGNGVPSIYGYGRATAQAAANASVATYTVGGSDGSFLVSANVLITAGSAFSFTVTCAYTDESNTARVATMSFEGLTGTLVQTIALGGGNNTPYEGVPLHIRAKSGTAITIATAAGGTYTTVTYNVEGLIQQVD